MEQSLGQIAGSEESKDTAAAKRLRDLVNTPIEQRLDQIAQGDVSNMQPGDSGSVAIPLHELPTILMSHKEYAMQIDRVHSDFQTDSIVSSLTVGDADAPADTDLSPLAGQPVPLRPLYQRVLARVFDFVPLPSSIKKIVAGEASSEDQPKIDGEEKIAKKRSDQEFQQAQELRQAIEQLESHIKLSNENGAKTVAAFRSATEELKQIGESAVGVEGPADAAKVDTAIDTVLRKMEAAAKEYTEQEDILAADALKEMMINCPSSKGDPRLSLQDMFILAQGLVHEGTDQQMKFAAESVISQRRISDNQIKEIKKNYDEQVKLAGPASLFKKLMIAFTVIGAVLGALAMGPAALALIGWVAGIASTGFAVSTPVIAAAAAISVAVRIPAAIIAAISASITIKSAVLDYSLNKTLGTAEVLKTQFNNMAYSMNDDVTAFQHAVDRKAQANGQLLASLKKQAALSSSLARYS